MPHHSGGSNGGTFAETRRLDRRRVNIRPGGHMPNMADFLRAATAAGTLAACALAAFGSPVHAQSVTPAMSPAPSATPASAPTAVPTPANPAENPLVTARVTRTFSAWQRGHINRADYSAQASGTYIDALVQQFSPDLAALGAVQSIRYQTASLLLGDVVYRYQINAASGAVSVLYALDPNGRLHGVERARPPAARRSVDGNGIGGERAPSAAIPYAHAAHPR